MSDVATKLTPAFPSEDVIFELAPVRSAMLSQLAGFEHGFYGRVGGVSSGIYESLNSGPGSNDDPANVADLSAAAVRHGTEIEVLVEIDCGAGRCGVKTTPEVVEIARAIEAAPGLKFAGLQAYQGAMQHMDLYADRKEKLDAAIAQVADAVQGLKSNGVGICRWRGRYEAFTGEVNTFRRSVFFHWLYGANDRNLSITNSL